MLRSDLNEKILCMPTVNVLPSLAYMSALERTLLSPTYKLESSLPQDYNIPAMQEFFRQRPRDVLQRTTQILSEIGQCIIASSMALLSSTPPSWNTSFIICVEIRNMVP
jgi:hypothetical protein